MPGRSARRESITDCQAGTSGISGEGIGSVAAGAGGSVSTHNARFDQQTEAVDGYDAVYNAVAIQVFGRLDTVGKLFAVQGFVDTGSEESHQSTGFRDGDVAEGSPRGKDPAGGGIAQVNQVRAGVPLCEQPLPQRSSPSERTPRCPPASAFRLRLARPAAGVVLP